MRSEAGAIADRARDDPKSALAEGHALLASVPRDDHAVRSIALRGLALAARLAGTLDESIGFAQDSSKQAELAGDSQLRSEALMTLSGSLALTGDNKGALEMLRDAREGCSGRLRAAILSQEGAIRQRLGETEEAMSCYSRALPIFREVGDHSSVALTLNNVAMLKLAGGAAGAASKDLDEARRLYAGLGYKSERAAVEHNLGMVAAFRGDIPEALRLFDQSESLLHELHGSAAEIQVSRAEVLMSAGLFREAVAIVEELVDYMHRTGLGEDEAEARLAGAQAALLAGDADVAIAWADTAAEMFTQQDRVVWAANARQVRLQAEFQAGVMTSGHAVDARNTAELLESQGQLIPGFNARLLAGVIDLELGMVDTAIDDLHRVAKQQTGPLEIRLQSWLAKALSRRAVGNTTGADAAARAGIRMLDRYQAALGATDIRTGVERHGVALAELGLRLALESGRPRRVLGWMERSRARALRHPPVVPADEQGQAKDLAELRRVSVDLRSAEGDEAQRLASQAEALQESVRNRGRTSRGTRDVARTPKSLPYFGARTLVEYALLDDRLWAVVVKDGRHRLYDIGLEAPVLAELESLRFTMRRLARRRGAATEDLARQIAARLDNMLFRPLNTGEGPLVIVPTPALHGTPWAALPTCRGRVVSVSPSAELWWKASRKRRRSGPILIVAGPDLTHAEAEMIEVGSVYPEAGTLGPTEANVEEIRTLFEPAAVAHIACHANFEFENPMFSSLRLSDGDLTVYDMERMRRVPQLVVLSACDSGFSDAHPGEELMGLSAALLSMGARSLIASVGLVPDSDATRALMLELHRNLRKGESPAKALTKAQAAIDDTPDGYVAAASFVCVGAG